MDRIFPPPGEDTGLQFSIPDIPNLIHASTSLINLGVFVVVAVVVIVVVVYLSGRWGKTDSML